MIGLQMERTVVASQTVLKFRTTSFESSSVSCVFLECRIKNNIFFLASFVTNLVTEKCV